jgi:hypothetical protein
MSFAFMKKEAHEILEKMEKLRPNVGYRAPESQVEITIEFARLLVVVADEQAESAAKLERQTNKLISLTVALVALTVALFLVTAYLCYDAYQHSESVKLANQSATK